MAKARILVVEDDRYYIEFYRDVLEREGFVLEVAHSAKEALRHLEGPRFDLVIADLVLKNSSGLELLAEIKQASPAQDVIMVTGMQSIRKAVDALKRGASDYLTKPVDKEELLLAIHTILERQVVKQEHSKLISENIHFYELQRIEKKKLALLAISDREKLQDALLDTLIGELKAPGAVLFMRDGEGGAYQAAASRGVLEIGPRATELSFATPGLRESLEEGRPLLLSETGEQRVPRPGEEGVQAVLPVRHQAETLGAVRLAARRGGHPYGSFDMDLGRHILEAGALALANARMVDRVATQGLKGDIPGTYNAEYFRSFCEVQLSVDRRYNREAAFILLRVSNLRGVSRQVKDSQARQFVAALCGATLEVIRETDLLARLDEDLFALFVPETDYYGGLMLKKRIRARLARMIHSLDLKREVVPLFQVGCAACPRDGGTYQALLEAATRRLEEERRSVFLRLKAEHLDLWEMVGRLEEPAVASSPAEGSTCDLRPVALSEGAFHVLARSLLRDLAGFYTSRGLLYLGVGTVSAASPCFVECGLRETMSVSIYVLGERSEGLWTLPGITPVFLTDPHLQDYLFLLGITEHFSYALFCRRDPGGGDARGFHSSDPLVVQELMTRLQDKYLLQRRIG